VVELGSVNRTTLREQVLAQLREGILGGSLAPGTKMGEVELAAQFGVSRGTVREALRVLQRDGLAEGEERLSLRVRKLTPKEIGELFSVRAALEAEAGMELLASPDRDALLDALEGCLPEFPSGISYSERFEIDLAFHHELCRLSGNRTLLSVWSTLKDLLRMTVTSVRVEHADDLMSRSNHEPIMAALRTGDPEAARRVIASHLLNAAEQWTRAAAAKD
jgi:DNA-binding GntR family transcriptional regulator